ncbi:MAG: hypothetical protein K2Z25_16275 [Beijerinckiaceae bacterium]|nr:hypothetical protein [Beijerinckiaceae bacterium]
MAHPAFESDAVSRAAMLLLQLAAAQAQIGPFARRALETPQAAARFYEIAAGRPAARPGRFA